MARSDPEAATRTPPMRGMTRRRALAVLAPLATGAIPGAVRAAPAAHSLSALTLNVLAPLWAAPRWYPETMDPALLDRVSRRAKITEFLRQEGRLHDVVCLQEVEGTEFAYFEQALGTGFVGAFASHDSAYWASYLVPELPWAPNGNALFVRRSTVAGASFSDLSLGGTGNHAVGVTALHAPTGRLLRAASVHLDADRNNGRRVELQALLGLMPATAGALDVIAGDINEDTVTGSAAGEFKRSGYADVLAAVGNREATHPFRESYNAAKRWAIIDHVMVRGASPTAGTVFDFGVWSISDEVARIEANFRRCGSDHFPVAGQVAF